MAKSKLGLFVLMLLLATTTKPMELFTAIPTTIQHHPFLTSAAALAALYGTAYGITQLTSYNKDVRVNLIDIKPTHANPVLMNYLFAHGIADTHRQSFKYIQGLSTLPYFINGRLFTYDYPDVTQRFWRVHFPQTGMGQRNEIMGLKDAHEKMLQTMQQESVNNDTILMGISRGATTILNFMGLYKPQNVKALIVESPFDSTQTIANNVLKKISLDTVPGMQTIGHYLVSAIFWQHSTKGIRAIDTVKEIDKELPILLICSRQDTLVPAESTIALYSELKKSGHTNAHIFVAEQGRHGKILEGPKGNDYQLIVHAFYKHYGLPHDAALAQAGAPLFAQCNPSVIN